MDKTEKMQKQVGEQQQQSGEEEGEEGAKYQPQVSSSSSSLLAIAFLSTLGKYQPLSHNS